MVVDGNRVIFCVGPKHPDAAVPAKAWVALWSLVLVTGSGPPPSCRFLAQARLNGA
jgi:hypothetical protein